MAEDRQRVGLTPRIPALGLQIPDAAESSPRPEDGAVKLDADAHGLVRVHESAARLELDGGAFLPLPLAEIKDGRLTLCCCSLRPSSLTSRPSCL
jgi:hypothetical protein